MPTVPTHPALMYITGFTALGGIVTFKGGIPYSGKIWRGI